MEKLDFIYNRHSVRLFTLDDVPMQDVSEIVKAATYAPSAKNVQNWHFVVVKNKATIMAMADLVERKNAQLAPYIKNEEARKKFMGMVRYHIVFKNAPVVILVYAGPYPSLSEDLAAHPDFSPEALQVFSRHYSHIQNVAAAMQNILLAATALGYGTCWMTGPTYAAEEISALIDFNKPGYTLAALTPLGVPAVRQLASPPRKPVDEVMTVIE